jgi:flagellar assembly protein FliH
MLEPATLNGWRVVEDGSLERGALLFEGPDGSISDGPAEWRRAIAAAVRG